MGDITCYSVAANIGALLGLKAEVGVCLAGSYPYPRVQVGLGLAAGGIELSAGKEVIEDAFDSSSIFQSMFVNAAAKEMEFNDGICGAGKIESGLYADRGGYSQVRSTRYAVGWHHTKGVIHSYPNVADPKEFRESTYVPSMVELDLGALVFLGIPAFVEAWIRGDLRDPLLGEGRDE